MRTFRKHWRLAPCICAGGLLFVNGCMAGLERGLDLILAPGAVGNALELPYSSLAGLARIFGHLFFG